MDNMGGMMSIQSTSLNWNVYKDGETEGRKKDH